MQRKHLNFQQRPNVLKTRVAVNACLPKLYSQAPRSSFGTLHKAKLSSTDSVLKHPLLRANHPSPHLPNQIYRPKQTTVLKQIILQIPGTCSSINDSSKNLDVQFQPIIAGVLQPCLRSTQVTSACSCFDEACVRDQCRTKA